jgi:hypothetical protein
MTKTLAPIAGIALAMYFWILIAWIAFILRRFEVQKKKNSKEFKNTCRKIYLLILLLAINFLVMGAVSQIGNHYKGFVGDLANDTRLCYFFLSIIIINSRLYICKPNCSIDVRDFWLYFAFEIYG